MQIKYNLIKIHLKINFLENPLDQIKLNSFDGSLS
jgi:hypothetical protein